VLDRGVMGVQVPHVNIAQDARDVVAAVKYHPLGKLAEYVAVANETTLIAVQLEDREAMDNIDELLKVEDIDVFFIGPSDLSQSMGHPGNPKAPALAQAIDSSFRKVLAAGRTLRLHAPTPAAGRISQELSRQCQFRAAEVSRAAAGSFPTRSERG
jgi:2-keto-3-deoxy-L-rhamnonate aldolase RhmA